MSFIFFPPCWCLLFSPLDASLCRAPSYIIGTRHTQRNAASDVFEIFLLSAQTKFNFPGTVPIYKYVFAVYVLYLIHQRRLLTRYCIKIYTYRCTWNVISLLYDVIKLRLRRIVIQISRLIYVSRRSITLSMCTRISHERAHMVSGLKYKRRSYLCTCLRYTLEIWITQWKLQKYFNQDRESNPSQSMTFSSRSINSFMFYGY